MAKSDSRKQCLAHIFGGFFDSEQQKLQSALFDSSQVDNFLDNGNCLLLLCCPSSKSSSGFSFSNSVSFLHSQSVTLQSNFEADESRKTRWEQLVENTRRKNCRKATRRNSAAENSSQVQKIVSANSSQVQKIVSAKYCANFVIVLCFKLSWKITL